MGLLCYETIVSNLNIYHNIWYCFKSFFISLVFSLVCYTLWHNSRVKYNQFTKVVPMGADTLKFISLIASALCISEKFWLQLLSLFPVCLDGELCASEVIFFLCICVITCKFLGWAGLLGFLVIPGRSIENLTKFSVPGNLKMVQLQVKSNSVQTSNLKNVTRRKYTSLTHFCYRDNYFSSSSFFQQ